MSLVLADISTMSTICWWMISPDLFAVFGQPWPSRTSPLCILGRFAGLLDAERHVGIFGRRRWMNSFEPRRIGMNRRQLAIKRFHIPHHGENETRRH